MARFDLYNNPSSRHRAKLPYLLDVRSDHLGDLMSRVVIPLTCLAGNYTSGKVAQDLRSARRDRRRKVHTGNAISMRDQNQ
ncbi:CcdB family protein [Paraburkholderia fungorum]|uniref:CcdB family protein n=1 Tax=Paraburkholderia fungorum TaxID=134537 RepID=UPI0038B86DE5